MAPRPIATMPDEFRAKEGRDVRPRSFSCVGYVLAIGVFVSLPSWISVSTAADPQAPVKLGQKSVTVYPVVVTPNKDLVSGLGKRLGEVVGMLLERADMKDVRLSDAEFLPKEGDKVDQVATAFGKFVAEQKIDTPYALLGEILGERGKGIDAIRTIVVNAKGNVVFAEEVPSDAFAKSASVVPKDPMTCCVFIAQHLRGPWGLSNPLRKDAPDGKVQEKWRERSGIPTDEEIAAIKKREEKLRKHLAESSLIICPAYVGQEPAPKTPGELTAMLADVGFASVQATEKGPDLRVQGSPNEQEVLWRTARKVRAYFKEHTPASDYVLVADFAIGHGEKGIEVEAVHWFLCDQQGDWVIVDYQNSHHSDFQKIAPNSVEDCLELVKVRVKKRLAEAN